MSKCFVAGQGAAKNQIVNYEHITTYIYHLEIMKPEKLPEDLLL